MSKEFKSWSSYSDFAYTTIAETRYVHDKEVEEFLETLYKTCEEHIELVPKGSLFWRAQLGHEWEDKNIQDDVVIEIEVPLPDDRMKPLPERASEGRANPKGISFLYLATKRDTALAEVRPWIGSLISVAQFETQRDLKIINFASDQKTLIYSEEPSSVKKAEAVWARIDKAFARPITPSDDVADYVPTQIIAELFKSKGFEGIAFRSSLDSSAILEKGHNMVLFDVAAVEQINCFLFEVKSVDFDFSQVASPYFIKK